MLESRENKRVWTKPKLWLNQSIYGPQSQNKKSLHLTRLPAQLTLLIVLYLLLVYSNVFVDFLAIEEELFALYFTLNPISEGSSSSSWKLSTQLGFKICWILNHILTPLEHEMNNWSKSSYWGDELIWFTSHVLAPYMSWLKKLHMLGFSADICYWRQQ